MAASSKHLKDIISWIEKVIDSCENTDQLFSANNLLINFTLNYKSIPCKEIINLKHILDKKLYYIKHVKI